MKIERNDEFVPVTLTLTTQAEVDMFASLLNAVRIDKAEKTGINASVFYSIRCTLASYKRENYSTHYFVY